ncbi:MAG: bifunctional UDP-N-acetylglucosamine diphosphorylase/glucosamine-1-phosphate N-acetyltransferase GlmU [Acidobacteria bacterium]|nr:MAG: bifunctional UDP-N-acetylglucosamine diphosphorylase/glucosamine-1-phosphate N-acetyltransferase GlmU [Acidobacteriota bacterium]
MRRTPDRKASKSLRRSEPPLAAVILAAGEGTRMRSRRAKVLHEAAGRPLVEHVLRAARGAGTDPVVVVVGVQADEVREKLGPGPRYVIQTERRGTADAVRRAGAALRGFGGDVLILCGDVPALPAAALRGLVRRHRSRKAALTVLTAVLDDPSGYGRILRGPDGAIRAIVEERDAGPAERAVSEINTGTYCARWPELRRVLRRITPDNAQGEFYLTDAVRILIDGGARVEAVVHEPAREALGVNSRAHLAEAHRILNERVLARLMRNGVTILDPATTWVHDTVRVGRDTVIHPGVALEGATRVGTDCVIRSGCRLTDVVVESGVELLEHTVAAESRIGAGSRVGPFAHLRPGSVIGRGCRVGNFVETKKASLGDGSKASHLSYLGDARIGREVNIGAGTITCNYDGVRKHRTELADRVFVGSDTQFVAPVRVGEGAYVAAGSTVTEDVPPRALAIARSRQRNIPGWVDRRRNEPEKR